MCSRICIFGSLAYFAASFVRSLMVCKAKTTDSKMAGAPVSVPLSSRCSRTGGGLSQAAIGMHSITQSNSFQKAVVLESYSTCLQDFLLGSEQDMGADFIGGDLSCTSNQDYVKRPVLSAGLSWFVIRDIRPKTGGPES